MCWIYSAEYSTEHIKQKALDISGKYSSIRIYFTFLTLWEIRCWESHQCLMILILMWQTVPNDILSQKYLQYLPA